MVRREQMASSHNEVQKSDVKSQKIKTKKSFSRAAGEKSKTMRINELLKRELNPPTAAQFPPLQHFCLFFSC